MSSATVAMWLALAIHCLGLPITNESLREPKFSAETQNLPPRRLDIHFVYCGGMANRHRTFSVALWLSAGAISLGLKSLTPFPVVRIALPTMTAGRRSWLRTLKFSRMYDLAHLRRASAFRGIPLFDTGSKCRTDLVLAPREYGTGLVPWLAENLRSRSGCVTLVPNPSSPVSWKKCLFYYWDPLYPIAAPLREIQNEHLQFHPQLRSLALRAQATYPRYIAVHLRLDEDFIQLIYGRTMRGLLQGNALDRCILSRCPQCRSLPIYASLTEEVFRMECYKKWAASTIFRIFSRFTLWPRKRLGHEEWGAVEAMMGIASSRYLAAYQSTRSIYVVGARQWRNVTSRAGDFFWEKGCPGSLVLVPKK